MKKTESHPGAILLGANATALGVVRSLGPHGIPTWVYDPVRSIAHFSRYTHRSIVSDREKHELLLEEGKKHGLEGWVIFPVEDQYVELLAIHHQSLSSMFRVTTPPLEITKFALDKRLTYSKAAELGIAAPWSVTGDRLGDDTHSFPYPLILKPAVNHHYFPKAKIKALPVDNAADLQRQFESMSQHIPAAEILIQERIPGGGENQFSLAGLFKQGAPQATLVARRTRQYPPDFGTASTFVETIDQPVVEAHGKRWLESVGYDGMVEVEFKFDPRDGKYKILDVNARPWGWHTLGKAAGMDFSYLLWRQKMGLPLPPIQPRKAAWSRELNDLITIAKSSNRGEEIQKLLKAFVGGPFTTATFSFRDPLPLFAELALRAQQVFRGEG